MSVSSKLSPTDSTDDSKWALSFDHIEGAFGSQAGMSAGNYYAHDIVAETLAVFLEAAPSESTALQVAITFRNKTTLQPPAVVPSLQEDQPPTGQLGVDGTFVRIHWDNVSDDGMEGFAKNVPDDRHGVAAIEDVAKQTSVKMH